MITILYQPGIPHKLPERLLNALEAINEEFAKEDKHLVLRIEEFMKLETRYEPSAESVSLPKRDN